MYIKSITIDGFKSYGNRTEINGFDPEFNAITGLNGTGKSNILDSICFVLGISNLTHVRANSLQDLIYKSGQAGVTKASVSIIFDNSDKSKSPINYEHCSEISVTRQITVAGKNRYMINSSSATNKTVADFFNSIQLNVNNPHFLIMQGRITKVLNMKPPEILSMIEEAAGTRMYENKKTDAQKVIERKDGKMKEIDSLVVEQINPKLQRMKEDRNHYVEYQSICRSLENYSRLKTAWEYVNLEETYENLEKDLTNVNEKLTNLEKTVADKKDRIGALDQEIVQIQSDLDKETGGQLQGLELTLKEAEKVEAKALAEAKSMQETITIETKNLKHLQKTINDDEKALELKRSEMEKAQDVFDSLRKAEEEDAEALALAQKKYQAVCSGLLESEDGDNATLQDQLMAVKQQVSEAETEMKKCTLQIQLEKKNLASKKPLLKKTEADFAHDKKELNVKENELKSLRESLSKCQYTEGQLENLQNRARELEAEYRACHELVTNFSHQFPQLNFQYSDPEPNFDRRKVKGLTCKLFSMKDDQYAQALEAAAGGKLYNVVTDNENTSAKLIEQGRLTKRATFAPLNKVRGYSIEASIVRRAQQEYGPNNVFLAKDLINYQPEFESIMAWMFGQTLICSTIDIAESLCTKYMKKTVSIDGSSFDPDGVIKGGAQKRGPSVLSSLIEYKKAEAVLSSKKSELDALQNEIRKITPIAQQYETMRGRAEVRARELEMVRARIEQTTHFQLESELKVLEESIAENESKIKELKNEIKEKSSRVADLEHKMKNIHSIKEKQVATAEAELKKAKKRAEDSRAKWKQREQDFETLKLEIEELEKSLCLGKEQLTTLQETIHQLQEDLKIKTEELRAIAEDVKQKKADVYAKKTEIGQKNNEVQKRTTEKDNLVKYIEKCELDIVTQKIQQKKINEDMAETTRYLSQMKKQYKWISEDRQYFMTPGGRYDLNSYDPKDLVQRTNELKAQKERLEKNLNTKAMEILGNKEENFQDVMSKKEIIEEDRSKILSVIEELDVKKEEVLRVAWDKVNHDFHSILSSLLPNAMAKLKPIDGKDFTHGLEVKVGFSGIWKDSLDELSGGQRSLVALSLILAMLLFKPAPLYILDEVDAALDPSHTQNIGTMLKTHFRQSQSLVEDGIGRQGLLLDLQGLGHVLDDRMQQRSPQLVYSSHWSSIVLQLGWSPTVGPRRPVPSHKRNLPPISGDQCHLQRK